AHAAHRCTSSVQASLVFLPGFDVSIKPGAGQVDASSRFLAMSSSTPSSLAQPNRKAPADPMTGSRNADRRR
ncbi:hypothetical protein, partial [Micromonospora sp. NPDC050200]|uniref:hypothetical protein n=1 Tax=Micromonospora sp. NPDC050200 TaxID=3155664 RepID=UPI003410F084